MKGITYNENTESAFCIEKYLPPRERGIRKILKAASFAPLVLGALLILPGIGNPPALSGNGRKAESRSKEETCDEAAATDTSGTTY